MYTFQKHFQNKKISAGGVLPSRVFNFFDRNCMNIWIYITHTLYIHIYMQALQLNKVMLLISKYE